MIEIDYSGGITQPKIEVARNIHTIEEALDYNRSAIRDAVLDGLRDFAGALKRSQGSDAERQLGRNRDRCDGIFSIFSYGLLAPCVNAGLGHSAATFSAQILIPDILKLEHEMGVQFHKGAIFFNTALAFFVAGDQQRAAYFLAMSGEEDHRTCSVEGKEHSRWIANLYQGELSKNLLTPYLEMAVDLLNGVGFSDSVTHESFFGIPLKGKPFDEWRMTLDTTHHFDLFRFLQDVYVFVGKGGPDYPYVLDNDYVLLRIARVLAQATQWMESYLTSLLRVRHGVTKGNSLSGKLKEALEFEPFRDAAGGPEGFVGSCPKSVSDVNKELDALLLDMQTQSDFVQKGWRALRIAYILRNATAHEIDKSLRFYADRTFALALLRVVLIDLLVIHKVLE